MLKNEVAKEEALKNLDGYRAEFTKFLETAADGRLKSDALAERLQIHVEQLVEHSTAMQLEITKNPGIKSVWRMSIC
ncbi:hypothetical protein ACQCWA_06105 [Rossellomorea aquimaris]|uniref:hypothetical protein n=1 Tax=Bacillaceae TaxID=186817 RepID=UPI0011EF3B77|nr:hypothetical protein [Bacillus sp. CH30_1T]KAA0566863.1 hypothetical protein F0342_02095 [Bacillus sp. CH30_1T]